MEKLILTKEYFNSDNEYIGKEGISNWRGHIEIESDLGWLKFKSLLSVGYICAKSG